MSNADVAMSVRMIAQRIAELNDAALNDRYRVVALHIHSTLWMEVVNHMRPMVGKLFTKWHGAKIEIIRGHREGEPVCIAVLGTGEQIEV